MVGIPATHIFTINPRSVIVREKPSRLLYSSHVCFLCMTLSIINGVFRYKDLHDVVDLIFPPMDIFSSSRTDSTATYWLNNPTMDTFNDEIQTEIYEINKQEQQPKAGINQ
jgi:phosphatidate phosphatase PAH1